MPRTTGLTKYEEELLAIKAITNEENPIIGRKYPSSQDAARFRAGLERAQKSLKGIYPEVEGWKISTLDYVTVVINTSPKTVEEPSYDYFVLSTN